MFFIILTIDFSSSVYPMCRTIFKVPDDCSVMFVVVFVNCIQIYSFIFPTCMRVSRYACERV